MAILGFTIEEIQRLIAIVESGRAELIVWDDGDRMIRVRGFSKPAGRSRSVGEPAPRTLAPAPQVEALPANVTALAAPMTGIFYRSESPDLKALVEVGDVIKVGQTIGIIEAMKVFSEIPAETAGEVIAIPAQNGQLTLAGDPLVLVRADVGTRSEDRPRLAE
jgi:acetyl-CoA carboxylase biotin carboxyl carrier protein